jgi:hypothetical protein
MSPQCARLHGYLAGRPKLTLALEWLGGRRYLVTVLGRGPLVAPLAVVIAYQRGDAGHARRIALAFEQDWPAAPSSCQEAYEVVLAGAPSLIVLDLRRENRCGCLGHRHPIVREPPFAVAHETFGGGTVGEIDIAWKRVEAWPALPLEETALDARFFEGSRLDEFHECQSRLRLLSVFLHETNHLVNPHEPEESVRARSVNFYREALSHYVEEACATMAFTIDRSFSRME